jgi:hypothetical protein
MCRASPERADRIVRFRYAREARSKGLRIGAEAPLAIIRERSIEVARSLRGQPLLNMAARRSAQRSGRRWAVASSPVPGGNMPPISVISSIWPPQRHHCGLFYLFTSRRQVATRISQGTIPELLHGIRFYFLGARAARLADANWARSKSAKLRLLRLSKNLPHDWKEQRRFLGFDA